MDNEIETDDLIHVIRTVGSTARSVTAIAGAPGSGKSTLAETLVTGLNAIEPGCAAILPMDGYHFDDTVLRERGWLARKGAPHTFDVSGFAHMLARLRANEEPEIAVPVFDRTLEIARNSARIIAKSVQYLIVEGNYLLLNQDPWPELRSQFDITVFLDVPMPTLTSRLEERWKDLDAEGRARKLNENDLPNAVLVIDESCAADYVVRDR